MTSIGRALGALGIVVLLMHGLIAQAAVTASLDRDRVALGDTLRLTITATDGEDLDQLDLTPLSADFEILGRSSSSKTSYINGTFSSSKELLLDITPRREGMLAIPPLRSGRQVTQGLPVAVGPPPANSLTDQTLVFEAELDRTEVYVQGQVILTLRLQQAINLDDRNITELQLDNAFVQPLEQNSFQRTINGRPWLIHEVRYAIFPEQSGTLEIPAQVFSARESAPRRSMFDLGRGGRQVRRSTQALSITVLPRPDSYPNAEWLPATELTLEETWSTPPEQLRVGESVTRTITIRGEGLQGAQLPPMLFPATEGLKYYPDQPVIGDSESPGGLVGERVDSVAIVPTVVGRWQIPEVRIPWWDTQTNELRYAVLPARQLDVTGAIPATPPPPVTQTPVPVAGLNPESAADIAIVASETGQWWPVIAGVNGAGWVLTILYLLWTRGRPKKAVQQAEHGGLEGPAFKALLNACAAGNAPGARKCVIEWAAAFSAQPNLGSLAQVSKHLADPGLGTALEGLDAALYGGRGEVWHGAALAEAATGLRKKRRQHSGEPPALQLYPQPG